MNKDWIFNNDSCQIWVLVRNHILPNTKSFQNLYWHTSLVLYHILTTPIFDFSMRVLRLIYFLAPHIKKNLKLVECLHCQPLLSIVKVKQHMVAYLTQSYNVTHFVYITLPSFTDLQFFSTENTFKNRKGKWRSRKLSLIPHHTLQENQKAYPGFVYEQEARATIFLYLIWYSIISSLVNRLQRWVTI